VVTRTVRHRQLRRRRPRRLAFRACPQSRAHRDPRATDRKGSRSRRTSGRLGQPYFGMLKTWFVASQAALEIVTTVSCIEKVFYGVVAELSCAG
jgi:hypothetical protein